MFIYSFSGLHICTHIESIVPLRSEFGDDWHPSKQRLVRPADLSRNSWVCKQHVKHTCTDTCSDRGRLGTEASFACKWWFTRRRRPMNFIELQSCVVQLGAVCNGMSLALCIGRSVGWGADFDQVLLYQTPGCPKALGKYQECEQQQVYASVILVRRGCKRGGSRGNDPWYRLKRSYGA